MTRYVLALALLSLSACTSCEEITGIKEGDIVSIEGLDRTYLVKSQTYYSAGRCRVFLHNEYGEHDVFSDVATFKRLEKTGKGE